MIEKILAKLTCEKAAEHFGVSLRTINRWRAKHNIKNKRRYSDEQKQLAMSLARKVGPCQAGRELGINRKSISSWMISDLKRRTKKWKTTATNQ
jgi:transposase-like protein